jgi:hypothetical protein
MISFRRWDFFAYTCVGISIGSLTGLLVSHPYPWIVFSFVVAFAMARQP